jgi:hypothetical protein
LTRFQNPVAFAPIVKLELLSLLRAGSRGGDLISGALWGRWVPLAAFFLLAGIAHAQESLRASMAGEAAAEARKQALSAGRYNLRLGPISLRFQSGLEMDVTDNVRLAESHPQADLMFRPQFNVVSVWPVSEKNSLSLSLGVGYVKYVKTASYDNLFVSPNSDLSFDLYVHDFAINFHDRFSYSQDAYTDPTISGTGSFGRFENTSGIGVIWDLNKFVLNVGYDHDIYIPTSSNVSDTSRAAELFTASAGFNINPFTQAGLQLGGGLTHYDKQGFNDNEHAAAGPFLKMQLSQYSTLQLALGYVVYYIEPGGSVTNTSSIGAFYGDLTFKQRVNANFAHSVSIGRQVTSGLFSDIVDLYYARYGANWRLFRKTSLGVSLSYEHGNEHHGFDEKLDRYGLGFSLGRSITRHASGSVGYQFYLKNAQPTSLSYTENRLVLNLNYVF